MKAQSIYKEAFPLTITIPFDDGSQMQVRLHLDGRIEGSSERLHRWLQQATMATDATTLFQVWTFYRLLLEQEKDEAELSDIEEAIKAIREARDE